MFHHRTESLSHLINANRVDENARLLDQEVKLTVEIAGPAQIDRTTIDEVIVVAKKLAFAGCPLRLVDNGEMLDIDQTFCFSDPNCARIEQELVLEDHKNPPFGTRLPGPKFLDYAAELVTSPNADTANHILVKLLAKLKDTDNPAWTARVAAVLAYFSALK